MKSLLVVLVTAGAVVGLYFLVADSAHQGSYLDGVGLDRPEPGPELASTGGDVITELPGVWPRSGPTVVSKGLKGPGSERPEVHARLQKVLGLTTGRDVRRIDRGQMTRALWEIERSLRPDDLGYLLDIWRENEDPAFRWALSWLFERIKSDEMVPVLEQLIGDHPRRATDAIASIGTPRALQRLTERVPDLPEGALRAHAMTRIGQSRWDGAEEYLASVWNDRAAGDHQRMAAVEALAGRVESPDASRLALELALGGARPVSDLGKAKRRWPEADLREPAVMAVMRLGDQASALALLEAADASDADPALRRMVDLHLGGFQGPDLSRVVLDRIARRGEVTLGEAQYLLRTANRDDALRLANLRDAAADPKVRKLLDAAATAARGR